MTLERINARGMQIADKAAGRLIARLAREASLPRDVRIETDETGITLSGRALVRRMLDDPRLRSLVR